MPQLPKQYQVLKPVRPWQGAFFYQKSEVIYQLTYAFCRRFLPPHGDRTTDQMIQAARSGKQNIVEGTEDGQTSTEMHLKLLGVARGSLQELRQDYHDYLLAHNLSQWLPQHPRFPRMQAFCKQHNQIQHYQPYFDKWDAETMANTAITLCHQVDTMLHHHLQTLQREFAEQGGIKERMHAVRTGYRQEQDAELRQLRLQVPLLQAEIARLQRMLQTHGIEY
ncbi:MAG: four helix bundle suffix domain-containing protein [Bacteroidales bacterium]|nr:four helix bundle suffix domain-containing protein [Bacteroidales bacterium]